MLGRVAPALLLLLLAVPGAAALRIPPPPDRRVNDYAGALAPAERERLEQSLIAREASSRNQIVVAIFRSLEGESLEDYSIRLAQAWRIGQKGLDNGVIFLVFLDDRKMRIEVGYGLEGNLTDAISSSILRDVVAPRFREGRIADGIGAGLDAIERAIAGTYVRPPSASGGKRPGNNIGIGVRELIALGFVLVLIFALVQNRMQNQVMRRRGWTGSSTGWGGPYIGGGGFGGGGFDGGSSGGGGFSGGGGSFGGGGSSGSW